MNVITTSFDLVDARITQWMARHGLRLLRISLGLVFLWFGALKPTLEGQYIIKNAVLISAAIVLGATVRGGRTGCGKRFRA